MKKIKILGVIALLTGATHVHAITQQQCEEGGGTYTTNQTCVCQNENFDTQWNMCPTKFKELCPQKGGVVQYDPPYNLNMRCHCNAISIKLQSYDFDPRVDICRESLNKPIK